MPALGGVSRRIIPKGAGDIAHLTVISNLQVALKSPIEDGGGETQDILQSLRIFSCISDVELSCDTHATMTSLGAFLSVRYPRMLGYQFPNILHYNRLANDVFNKKQQIVAYTPPPPSPAPEQEPHHPIHVVWNPFKQVDKKKKVALSKFLKDRKSKLSTVDGFDKISKEVYNLFLANGGWLNNDGMDVVLYFIRKRIDNNSGLFPSNMIIADCFFWASMLGCYNKHVVRDPHVNEDIEQFEKNIEWASEMNDRPFSEYYTGKMPLGSSSWTHKDIVYIPVNNNGAHWGDCGVYALKYIEYLIAGRPFDFNSSYIALFKEKYAVEIFHNGM
ncbi:hypothetical protein FNV43_RR05661 [Rhamnella rubrinervis]|uniref:Ubiquitin-like protease family profile domain-containing protein n=1 Tax=Rhamnella rubrinervis TaxID=2594499 RepID=A0A8K0MRF7_9ROSA|nr:hypothetical protein FNV43_RR05661 [Rhamnella rubrinervis]